MSLAGINGAHEILFLAIKAINGRDPLFNGMNAIDRGRAVAIPIQKQDRTWSNQAHDSFGVKMVQDVRDVIINTVSLEEFVANNVLVSREATDRDARLQPFIQGHEPPGA